LKIAPLAAAPTGLAKASPPFDAYCGFYWAPAARTKVLALFSHTVDFVEATTCWLWSSTHGYTVLFFVGLRRATI